MNSSKNSLRKNSYIIAGCILLSRVFGLVREIILARYLGTSIYSDALKAALRIPNFLQNMFGEGVLSASFIPTYSRLRAEKKDFEASSTAIEIGIILLIVVIIATIFGTIGNELLIAIFAAGFTGETREIASKLITIIFPATSLLVLSAWCLGILNSHRKFILSYSSPLAWNLTIIFGLVLAPHNLSLDELTLYIAKLFLIGSLLQLLVQLPKTLSFIWLKDFKVKLTQVSKPSRVIIKTFFPVVLSRGVVQLSAYLDTIIASFLNPGSLSSLLYAQTIYLTPVSAFGLSNAAASLPEFSEKDLSSLSEEEKAKIEFDIKSTTERALFFTLPTSIIFVLFGLEIIRAILESGKFDAFSSNIVYFVLTSLTLGLIPTTWSRIITSLLYAAGEQKALSKIAIVRLLVCASLSLYFCFYLMPLYGLQEQLNVGGIGFASSITSLMELCLINNLAVKKTKINPLRLIVSSKTALMISVNSFLSLLFCRICVYFIPLGQSVQKFSWAAEILVFSLSYLLLYKLLIGKTQRK